MRHILFLLLFLAFSSCQQPETKNDTIPNQEIDSLSLVYGFDKNDFIIYKDQIKKNEFLADILLRYKVPYQNIDQLATFSKSNYDVRKIRAGKNYAILCNANGDSSACYFIYEKNPIDYIVYGLQDSLIYECSRPVETRTREASGSIESSLYLTMMELDISPALVNKVANIYAWSIDFFGIQKGDNFKIVFDEKYVEGKRVGIGNVHACVFEHNNTPYYAIKYETDTLNDYYDLEGKSLRKALLKAPLSYTRISSKFSNSRLHPILKIYRPHHGVDYAAPYGTPVYSVGDGTIIAAAYSKGAGKYIKIKHGSSIETKYLHLKSFASGIRKGATVKQGQKIGEVGSTGLSTGPHLDYRLVINGTHVNPVTADIPSADPLTDTDLNNYMAFMPEWQNRLNSINLLTFENIGDTLSATH